MASTKEEIEERVKNHVAKFEVGNKVLFSLYGDGEDFDMEGVILSISEKLAKVEHKYGVCEVFLPIAKIVL